MPKVDLAHYAGREQAYIKHCLLEEYLPEWGYKVGTQWDSLIYVDGFAGPWGVAKADLSDSSFGVAASVMKQMVAGLRDRGKTNLNALCILVEKQKEAHQKLEAFAVAQKTQGFDVRPLQGEFIDRIPDIQKLVTETGSNPFKFVFLDPKGWIDIPMQSVGAFLRGRSSEVLITLMTRHITRFLEEDDRAESYSALFGRDGVLDLLKKTPREDNERAEGAVREYCKSLKQLCNFRYVSSAVILEPNEEAVRYFLVFATNHHRGVEVFKAAEMKAAKIQDEVRSEAKIRKSKQPEFLFDGQFSRSPIVHTLRERYLQRARRKFHEMLRASASKKILYRDLFCEVMAFPLVTPNDLVSWIDELNPAVTFALTSSDRKKPSPAEDDSVTVSDLAKIPRD